MQGTPTAYFPNTSCDINAKMGAHNIIINLTLCARASLSSPLYAVLTGMHRR